MLFCSESDSDSKAETNKYSSIRKLYKAYILNALSHFLGDKENLPIESNRKIMNKIVKELREYGLELVVDYKTLEILGIKIDKSSFDKTSWGNHLTSALQ